LKPDVSLQQQVINLKQQIQVSESTLIEKENLLANQGLLVKQLEEDMMEAERLG
jgi:hypothetical protein